MAIRSLSRLLLVIGACMGLAVGPNPAAAQISMPAGPPHLVILLEAYLDYAALLLTPPRSFDLLGAPSRSEGHSRMLAYREFERALRERTAGLASASGSSEERRRAKRKMLADIGGHLERLTGSSLLRQGQALWRVVEKSTDFELGGYRVRLRMDEAVEGKLALGIRRQLR